MIIIWSGLGLLVPAIAFISCLISYSCFGHSMPSNAYAGIGAIISAVLLAAVGVQLRKRNIRRHLYWIPMEYWSVVALLTAMSCLTGVHA